MVLLRAESSSACSDGPTQQAVIKSFCGRLVSASAASLCVLLT